MKHAGVICAMWLFAGTSSVAALQPGTVAIYSNGDVEKLVVREAGGSVWEDGRKRRIVRVDNPMLPAREMRQFLGDRGYREELASGRPDELMRAPNGSRAEFKTRRTPLARPGSQMRNWQCEVVGSGEKKVLGRLRTVQEFRCERFTVHRKLWTKKIKETRTIRYASDLGLVVDMRRERPGKADVRRRLVALLAPEKASYEAIRSRLRRLQDRPETKP